MSSPSSSSSDNAIIYHPTPEGIATITINRPHRRNAINPPAAHQLRVAFLAFEADDTQKICLFTGANGTFCAGYDLHDFAASGDSTAGGGTSSSTEANATDTTSPGSGSIPASTPVVGPVDGRNAGPMGPSRMTISKPVIAAISGHAVAGGLELSLLADMRVAEEDAVLGVFCRRFGVPLIDGGTVRLQRIIGLGRAMDMILTGRGVGAREAEGWGLVNRVVPRGQAMEEARRLARSIIAFPQACVNVDRRSVYFAAYQANSLEDALAYEYANGVSITGGESLDGARRFRSGVGRHGKL